MDNAVKIHIEYWQVLAHSAIHLTDPHDQPDGTGQCPDALFGALGSLDEHNAHYATVVTDAQSS